MSHSSHNHEVGSVSGGAASVPTPATQAGTGASDDASDHKAPFTTPSFFGNEKASAVPEGGYKPSTGAPKTLTSHAGKLIEEAKMQSSHIPDAIKSFGTGITGSMAGKEIGGNQLFNKADATGTEGTAGSGFLNKYVDETAPGEGTS